MGQVHMQAQLWSDGKGTFNHYIPPPKEVYEYKRMFLISPLPEESTDHKLKYADNIGIYRWDENDLAQIIKMFQ